MLNFGLGCSLGCNNLHLLVEKKKKMKKQKKKKLTAIYHIKLIHVLDCMYHFNNDIYRDIDLRYYFDNHFR